MTFLLKDFSLYLLMTSFRLFGLKKETFTKSVTMVVRSSKHIIKIKEDESQLQLFTRILDTGEKMLLNLNEIEGFSYTSGYLYILKVKVFHSKSLPEGASSVRFKLVKVLARLKV